jgi:hypothetical protein
MAVSSVWNEARSGGIAAGLLFGLTMSTAGGSATLSVAPGFCADSTGLHRISLGAALAKTTAIWAAGAGGGLDAGTIANNTWYHWYAIFNPTTGASDVVFSATTTPLAGPTALPAGFTAWRRLGWWKTNGSGQWLSIRQTGDVFQLDIPVSVVSAATQNTSANTYTMPLPIGIPYELLFGAYGTSAAALVLSIISFELTGNSVASAHFVTTPNGFGSVNSRLPLGPSGSIKTVANGTSVTDFNLFVQGWVDTRGRLAA